MTSYAPLVQHTPQTVTLPITQKPNWEHQASAKCAFKAWRVFCHWSATGKRLTVSTEQCSESSGGKKALWLGSKDHGRCQHSCPAGVSFRAAPNAKATTNLSLQQLGTQGHKGVNPACRGEGLSSVLTELYTSRSVHTDSHVLKWFNWLVYLDRKLTEYFDIFIIFAGQFCNYTVIFGRIPNSTLIVSLPYKWLFVYSGRLHMLSNKKRLGQNSNLPEVLKYVIQSTVNNLQGARLVESLLWKQTIVRVEILRAGVSLLCQVFVYTFIISRLYYPMPTSWVQSRGWVLISWRVRLTPLTVLCHTWNRRRVILQHMNQGKMKCTPDAFRWFSFMTEACGYKKMH